MANNKEPKPFKDMDDDELMAKVKEAVGVEKVAKIGKSAVVKAALEQKTKRSKN